jgi:hypothetical protein
MVGTAVGGDGPIIVHGLRGQRGPHLPL